MLYNMLEIETSEIDRNYYSLLFIDVLKISDFGMATIFKHKGRERFLNSRFLNFKKFSSSELLKLKMWVISIRCTGGDERPVSVCCQWLLFKKFIPNIFLAHNPSIYGRVELYQQQCQSVKSRGKKQKSKYLKQFNLIQTRIRAYFTKTAFRSCKEYKQVLQILEFMFEVIK